MADNSATSATKQPRKRGPGKPFQPGQSGNPGGRPKGIVAKVKEMAGGEDGAEYLAILDDIARGKLTILMPVDGALVDIGPSFKDRRECAVALLERGWGKPSQPLSGDGEGGAIQVVIQKLAREST